MNQELILIVIIFIILISFQYTLNLILRELRDINKTLKRNMLKKDVDES